MHNLSNKATPKKNFDFIDAIRGIAMMAIVAEHCVTAGNYVYPVGSPKYWLHLALVQLTKFGTISFFLLAGFLLGDKFSDYSPGEYLKRRLSTIFGPWVFWSLLFVLANVARGVVKEHTLNIPAALNLAGQIYMYSNYWFIINFLISITILLIFRRYLYSVYLGAILGLFTLFYTVNVHYEWISPQHTTAIFGFVFFLWLGAQFRKHYELVETRLKSISYFLIAPLFILTFVLAGYEIASLNHSVDPDNTLRFSNILYSLVAFILLLKIKTFNQVKYIKPRQTTYGIYLIHFILIVFLLPKLLSIFHIKVPDLTLIPYLLTTIVSFIIIYIITLLIVLILSKSRIKKLVGC